MAAATLTTWKRRRKFYGSPGRAPLGQVVLVLFALLLPALIYAQLAPYNHGSVRAATPLTRSTDKPLSLRPATERSTPPTGNESAQASTTTATAEAAAAAAKPVPQATTVRQPQDTRRRQKVKSSDAQAQRGRSQLAARGHDPQLQKRQKQVAAVAAVTNKSGQSSSNLWRPTKLLRLQQEPNQVDQQQPVGGPATDIYLESQTLADGGGGGLQVSITPRVNLVRVPVESNTILKCLISAQSDNFTRPFKIRWSRFMYDENVYEQIESSSVGFEDVDSAAAVGEYPPARPSAPLDDGGGGGSRDKRDDEQTGGLPAGSTEPQAPSQPLDAEIQPTLNILDRQQQLRDFLARSRQETNVISNILIEATLSISPVKASDNASYYCTATDGGLSDQNQARIDLLALSKPVMRLDRVWPARDSKSALVYWSIVSDGNTPIKRTILIVRNDSQSLIEARRSQQQPRYGGPDATTGGESAWPQATSNNNNDNQKQQHSSIVLDNERNQWHRIEIAGDGADQFDQNRELFIAGAPPLDGHDSVLPEDNVVRADMDVTSIAGGSSSSSSYSASGATHSDSSGQADRWRPRLKRKQRAFNLTSLLPGVTYQIRLAAVNDMGQSNWTQLQATMPNEIPAQISDIVVLSTTNDSMTIGWRRPPYDGAKTIRYELQLFDLNRTLTLDANTNTNSSGALRTNFMFHFVNLNPGTDYHFHIRACSPAGCSAYSSPKLLVSTLDGEPDEPLDVELTCHWVSPSSSAGLAQSGSDQNQPMAPPPSSQLSVSWLPPVNVRGKLLNYSVTIESSARYLNQSGQWASDEWRTTIQTGDNHTLSLEASNLLTPNTNYTARVCANNRSRRCGRPSQLSPRSQCSTPAELPNEVPANIQLVLRQLKLTDIDQDRQQVAETLVLELPFISLRNGSIDCIQIVLVRLPPSFDNSQRALSDLLPDDPAELKLQEYLELPDVSSQRGGESRIPAGGSPLAYLAEELSAANQSGDPDEVAQGIKQIFLGDGVQKNCNAIWARLRQTQIELGASDPPMAANGQQFKASQRRRLNSRTRTVRAIDGPLLAQTYYTGFLKLVQFQATTQSKLASRSVASTQSGNPTIRIRREMIEGTNMELVTKFSNYFSPIRTGEHVPEVSISSLMSEQDSSDDEHPLEDQARLSQRTGGSICAHRLVVLVQEKLGTNKTCLLAAQFAETIRKSVANLYKLSAAYLSERLRLTAAATDGGDRRVVTMQPLEIGLILIVSTLLVLFVVYLFLLPSRLNRKRKLRMKRKLQQHESSIVQQQQQQLETNSRSGAPPHQLEDLSGGFVQADELKVQQNRDQMALDGAGQQQLLVAIRRSKEWCACCRSS